MGGFAWVTLATNDSYSLGALVLAHSLKQSGTAHQLVVLVSPGVTNVMRQKLATVFNLVQEVNILDSKDEANLRLLKRPELGITFTKLHCWRLTQYDKCVFLDADTLILKNCDDLFEREEFSAAPDVGWPDCFNSGVFVYKPAIETYEKLIQFALDHGSFDGGDQGLLNLYFSDWAHKDISKHLPFIYNMCSTACYSYLPAFKYYGDNVKIVHFIGATKPWLQYFDTETKQVHPTNDMMHLKSILQSWWDIFCSLIHPNLTTDMSWSRPPIENNFPLTMSGDVSNDESIPETTQQSDSRDMWDPWEEYSSTLQIKPPVHPPSQINIEVTNQIESHNTNSQNSNAPSVVCPSPPNQQNINTSPIISIGQSTSPTSPATNVPNFSRTVTPPNVSCNSSSQKTIHVQNSTAELQGLSPQNCTLLNFPTANTPSTNQPSVLTSCAKNILQEPYAHNIVNPTEILVHSTCKDSKDPDTELPIEFEASTVTKDSTISSNHEASKDGGLAGAFAQLTLGSPRSPTQTALEDQLRRQGWEVGNVDYLGRDSFNNIWGKICQTLATPPQDKKEEIPSAPPTPTEKVASPPASSQETVKLQEVKPKEEPILETKVTEQQKPQKLAPEVIEKPLESKVETSKPETPINISDTTKPVEQPLQQETKKPEMTVEPSLPPKPVEDVQPVKSEEIAQPVQVSSIIEDILKPASPVPQATELAAPPQQLQEISKVLEEAIKATECLISPSKQVQKPVPAQPQAPVPAQPQTPIPAQPQTPVPVKPQTPVPAQPQTPIPAQPQTPVPAQPQTPVGLIEKDLKTDISALPELPPSPEKVKPLEEINVELLKPIEEPLKTNEPIIMPETSKPVEQVSAQIQPEEAVSVERKVDDKNQKQDAVEIPTPVEEISKQEELKTEVIPKTLDEIPQDAQLAEAVSKLVEEAPIDIPAEVPKATEVTKLDESKKDQQDVQKQEGKSGKKGGKGDGKGQKKNGEQACKMPEKGKVECQKGKEPQKPKPNDTQKGKDTKEAKPNEGQKGKGGKQPEHKGKEAKPTECQKEKAAKPAECQKSKESKDSIKPLDSDKEKEPKPSEDQKPKEEKPIEVPKEEAKPVESPKPDEPETETKGKEVEKQQKSKKNKNHKGPKTPETPPATKPEIPATKPEKSPPKTEAPVSKPDTPPAEVKNQEAEPQKLEGKKCQKKCKKECPKEGCEEKSCPKEVEVPKTPDVIEATPPMSPVATKPVETKEAEKPKEEKLLPTKAEIPATPPPASSTEQAPTPPPRKGNSGGKKTKGKK